MGKLGKCPKCPASSRDVLLIGGLCMGHFNGQTVERSEQITKAKKDAAKKQTLKAWYDEQLEQRSERCENCNKVIIIPANLSPRTAVCHILPKATFDSVKTHPLNRWFGCWQCHTDYDSASDKVKDMPVISIVKERMNEVIKSVAEEEKRRIPKYLLE